MDKVSSSPSETLGVKVGTWKPNPYICIAHKSVDRVRTKLCIIDNIITVLCD